MFIPSVCGFPPTAVRTPPGRRSQNQRVSPYYEGRSSAAPIFSKRACIIARNDDKEITDDRTVVKSSENDLEFCVSFAEDEAEIAIRETPHCCGHGGSSTHQFFHHGLSLP